MIELHDDDDKREKKNEEEQSKIELSEEELKKVVDRLKSEVNGPKVIKSNIFYHQNIAIHLLISLIINIIAGITLIGITELTTPLVEWTLLSFFIAITLFTLISNILTIIAGYLLIKKILYWFGIVHYIIMGLSFFLASVIAQYNFNFMGSAFNLIMFTTLFSIVVQMLVSLYKKIHRNILSKRR